MVYLHPYYHKEYDVVVGSTLFFNYITFKIKDAQYETFIYDPEDGGRMLEITDIMPNVNLSENQHSALTTTQHSTESLWRELENIGNKKLTEMYGQYLSNENNNNRTAEEWLNLMRKK